MLSLPSEGIKGPQLLGVGGARAVVKGVQHGKDLEQLGFAGFEAGGADGSGADGLEGSDRDFLGQAEDSCVCWMFPRVEAVCASLYCPPSF